jgi:diacylglycerol kinase (ATP)
VKNKYLNTGEHGYHPLHKFKIIFSGLHFVVLYDFSVMYKIVVSVAILVPILIFNAWIDASLIILSTGVMLAAELFSTAIEAICDFMEEHYSEKIRIIKDIAASRRCRGHYLCVADGTLSGSYRSIQTIFT